MPAPIEDRQLLEEVASRLEDSDLPLDDWEDQTLTRIQQGVELGHAIERADRAWLVSLLSEHEA